MEDQQIYKKKQQFIQHKAVILNASQGNLLI